MAGRHSTHQTATRSTLFAMCRHRKDNTRATACLQAQFIDQEKCSDMAWSAKPCRLRRKSRFQWKEGRSSHEPFHRGRWGSLWGHLRAQHVRDKHESADTVSSRLNRRMLERWWKPAAQPAMWRSMSGRESLGHPRVDSTHRMRLRGDRASPNQVSQSQVAERWREPESHGWRSAGSPSFVPLSHLRQV